MTLAVACLDLTLLGRILFKTVCWSTLAVFWSVPGQHVCCLLLQSRQVPRSSSSQRPNQCRARPVVLVPSCSCTRLSCSSRYSRRRHVHGMDSSAARLSCGLLHGPPRLLRAGCWAPSARQLSADKLRCSPSVAAAATLLTPYNAAESALAAGLRPLPCWCQLRVARVEAHGAATRRMGQPAAAEAHGAATLSPPQLRLASPDGWPGAGRVTPG